VKPLAHVAFALLLAAVQASLLRWLGGGALPVALLAACLVHQGLHGGNVDGAVASAGIGYVLDLVSGTPKGLMTFLAVAVFLAARLVAAAVEVRGRLAFARDQRPVVPPHERPPHQERQRQIDQLQRQRARVLRVHSFDLQRQARRQHQGRQSIRA